MARIVGPLVVLALLAAAGAAILAVRIGDEEAPARRAADPARCRLLPGGTARDCYTREFQAMVAGRDDPRPAVQAITDLARREGGFLVSSCHGLMHTVGRTYARDAGVTLATLMDYLPRSNDPGCSAGFAHGLVTGVAPRRPRDAGAICADAGTRYQRYSCVHGLGHAFMRLYGDRLPPALALCGRLGARAAPDCAQGAYHDYWFAVAGVDDASLPEDAVKDPRKLCAAQPAVFVRPCWYRAYLENRPKAFDVEAVEDLEALCDGLIGLQREACMTAASVIGPADPAAQLRLCADLAAPSDAAACVRGTKAQNLLGASTGEYAALIERCALFTEPARAECYRWLGKTLAVLTDGAFARAGCPGLDAADARAQCRAGARHMDDALVTFS